MAMEGKMDEKLEILRTEMKDTIKTEIGSIRDEIKSAIEDENWHPQKNKPSNVS